MSHHNDPVAALVFQLNSHGFDPREISPDTWESRCPGHDGSRHNLSIKRGDDGRALIFCHHEPSCPPDVILRPLGLGLSDLFPTKADRGQPACNRKTMARSKVGRRTYPTPEGAIAKLIREFGQPTLHWVYEHADGSEAFRVYRFDYKNSKSGEPNKSYRPVHPTPEGWVLGDPIGPLVLYRLPELADAPRVYVCEEEKAAERARGLGVKATTSAHGARSASKTDWSPLAGREVIILPDHDPEGERYTEAVLGRLARLDPCPRVRIVRLPDLWRTDAELPAGGDIEEWLAEGVPESWEAEQCRSELERLADDAPLEDLTACEAPDSPDSPDVSVKAARQGYAEHGEGACKRVSRFPPLPPGKIVQCVDRDPPNYGHIHADAGDMAEVKFLRDSEGERIVLLSKSDLRNQDGTELTGEGSEVLAEREWPPLRLGELPTVEPFPLDVLPDVIADYVREVAAAVGCDPGLAAGPALTIAGGVIGRSAHLALGPNRFASACVYQATIALPGDGKSPCLSYMMMPANKIERDLGEEFKEAKQDYKEALEEYDKAKKEGKGKGPVGDDEHEKPEPPVPRRLVMDDSTMEAVLRTLAVNERGLLICNDELSALLLGMNQYKSKGGNDLPVFLKIWSGKPVIIDRVRHELGEPVRIFNPHVCVTGNLPPAMLTSLTSKRGDIGFLDRWLFVYPDRQPKLKSHQRRRVSDAAIAGAERLIHNLWARSMVEGEDEACPHVIVLSDAGQAEYDRLHDLHVDEVNAADFPDSLRGPWSKLEEYASRLCLILALMHHAAETSYDPLDLPNVEPVFVGHAWRLVEYFKSHHRRVRAVLEGKGKVGMPHMSQIILNWIHNHQGVTSFAQSELTRTYPSSRYDRAEMEDGLAWLAKHNVVRRAQPPERPPGTPGKKPSPVWEIHPDLCGSSGESGDSGE